MKKLQFTSAIFTLALVASCSTDKADLGVNTPANEGEPFVIYASAEGSNSSRTALSGELSEGGDYVVEWQTGDAMNFFAYDMTDGKFDSTPSTATDQEGIKLVTSDSGTSAYFTTESADTEIPTSNTYVALTPYVSNGGVNGANIKLNNAASTRGTIFFRMPNEQTYVENTYDPSVAFAYAKAESLTDPFTFYNQFGVLRVNLVGSNSEKVNSIKVTAKSGYIAGYLNACTAEEYESNTLSVSGTENETKFSYITMTCDDAVTLSEDATEFNIVLVPFTAGVSIEITYNDSSTLTKSTSSAIVRSGITIMPTIDVATGDLVVDGDDNDPNNSTENLTPNDGTWEE